ncbi:MAG TPA: PilW family protein [Rhodocyclaceae bacterium]
MNRRPIPSRGVAASRQHGFSLVELMISLTIGLFLMAGVTALIVWQSGNRNELDKSSRQIENGRYAIELLADDIEHAGFYGSFWPPANTTTFTVLNQNTDAAADPCSTTDHTADLGTAGNFGWINNSTTAPTVPVPIYGYAGAATAPVSCLANYQPNTPVIVVRRAATTPLAATSAVAGTTYLQVSNCNTATAPFVLGTSGFTMTLKDCATPAPIFPYVVRIYYVASCNQCGTDTTPTLKVVEFVNGASTVRPLVEGIQDIQFDYGVDTGNDGSPHVYATDPTSIATYTPVPATSSKWGDVMAVRVSVLARNTDQTMSYTDTKTYTLGSRTVAAANDHYKRHVYSQLVRVVNPSGRRER